MLLNSKIRKMKIKVSISIDEDTLKEVEKTVEGSIFRNKSHLIEHATQKLLKEVNANEPTR